MFTKIRYRKGDNLYTFTNTHPQKDENEELKNYKYAGCTTTSKCTKPLSICVCPQQQLFVYIYNNNNKNTVRKWFRVA